MVRYHGDESGTSVNGVVNKTRCTAVFTLYTHIVCCTFDEKYKVLKNGFVCVKATLMKVCKM